MILLRQWEIGPQSDLFRSVSTMRPKRLKKLSSHPLVSSRTPKPDSLLAKCRPVFILF